MSDYNSSLPIRTENPGDAIVKIADSVTPSQQAQVTAARELSVLSSAQPGVDIGDVTVNNAAGAAAVNIQDGGNSITVDATNLDIRDLNSATDSVTVIQGTDPWNENLAQIAGAVPSATNALPSQLSDGVAFYDARDIRTLTSGDIVSAWISDSEGDAFSPSNPLPVQLAVGGDSVNDFKDAGSIASGASDDHDYTVTAATTLYLDQIEASASGKAKMELFIETGVATDVFVQKFVMFNSTADTNMSLKLSAPIPVAAGVRVRVTMTNRDLQAQDLYSTISGNEL